MGKRLLIFNLLHGPNIEDLSPQSNSWYLKNYESYFDKITHLSLMGSSRLPVSNGRSEFAFANSGNTLKNLTFAPFRLYRVLKKIQPTHIITYEQIWVWWTIMFVKWFTKTPVYLIPLTFPEQMYKVTGKGMSGKMPLWLERIFLRKSYRACTNLITSYNLGNYINWMQENSIIHQKLLISDSLPESVVFPEFMKRLNLLKESKQVKTKGDLTIQLIYVGRLHKEKMTDHLIQSLPLIRAKIPNIFLTIVGQGAEKDNLLALAKDLDVQHLVQFKDYVQHSALPDLLLSSDIFVSPSTGHAFREAAICGLPIVAYNIDWIKGFLTHRENFFGIDEINYEKFAEGIIEVAASQNLRTELSVNIKAFADRYWSGKHLQGSLESLFEKR